jgi:hypothetical protein
MSWSRTTPAARPRSKSTTSTVKASKTSTSACCSAGGWSTLGWRHHARWYVWCLVTVALLRSCHLVSLAQTRDDALDVSLSLSLSLSLSFKHIPPHRHSSAFASLVHPYSSIHADSLIQTYVYDSPRQTWTPPWLRTVIPRRLKLDHTLCRRSGSHLPSRLSGESVAEAPQPLPHHPHSSRRRRTNS